MDYLVMLYSAVVVGVMLSGLFVAGMLEATRTEP